VFDLAGQDRAGQEGRLLLLLDGLDEVPADRRSDAESLIRDLAGRWPEAPLVVTTRPIGYRSLGAEFRRLDVLPLDRDKRRRFLARWLSPGLGEPDPAAADRAELALAHLEADRNLWELSGNPLYLTLMALLFEQDETPSRNRTKLYDQVFDLLLEGRYRQRDKPEPIEAKDVVRDVLRHLAFALTEANRDGEAVGELERRLLAPELDALRAEIERVPAWYRKLRAFLDDVAHKTGILGAYDGPQADWRFWHRTFREALAAEHLAARIAKEGQSTILAHAESIAGDEGRWAEPYALLAGRVEDADALVKALFKANQALGLRAIATAQGLSDATLVEVLGLTNKWEERAEVYVRVPELIAGGDGTLDADDGDRALKLLDKLRRRTTDGNDLYFLDAAVREVGRRCKEQRRAADKLLARFYEHLEMPDPELFASVFSPYAKKRVPMWVEVPAGSFWMGAAKNEKGALDREKPQHQVTIKSPFRIGAVAITNRQYLAFDKSFRPRTFDDVSDEDLLDHPAVRITWYAAVAFCCWLQTLHPDYRGARLPVEEEWEYACRAGSTTRFFSGNDEADLAEVGWYGKNSQGRTHRVASKRPNDFGLSDVHGNAWEWTLSEWEPDAYKKRRAGHAHDPTAVELPAEAAAADPTRVALRVIRGGCFVNDADLARSAFRNRLVTRDPWRVLGFRVVLPPPEHR